MRAGRRQGDDLVAVAQLADAQITGQWSDLRFATAVLAELQLDTGVLRYINCGHPPPALVRRGRVVRLLDGRGGCRSAWGRTPRNRPRRRWSGATGCCSTPTA
jgi:hypothetical protein